jgi:alkylation response protein AidB-like acyl-CoA dehydrogenase
VDFTFPPELEEFRKEVKEFMDTELTPEIRDEYEHCTDYPHGMNKAITKKLGQRGWLTLTWPKEVGGEDASVWKRVVFDEEMAANHCPIAAHQVSANFAGPAVVHFANDEQKQKLLPPIARGESMWGIGLTEPNAGTDLASLELRAVRDGDEWVLNGSKMFTEHVQDADQYFLITRTDPDAPKHRGVSIIVVEPRTPGIVMTPLWTMDGYRVNQVFFEDVRVPADSLIGEENRGFYHLAMTLNTMRSSGLGAWTEIQGDLDELVEYAKNTKENGTPLIEDSWVADGIADFAIYARISRLLAYRVASMLESGGPAPDKETSVRGVWTKVYGQKHVKFASDVMGMAGQVGKYSPEHAPMMARWQRRYIGAIAGAHNGGTAENILNTVALRVLGLPR